jgi:hypothetical protein
VTPSLGPAAGGTDGAEIDRFESLRPGPGEAAALSLLAVRADGDWNVVCGSLLSLPEATARVSWREWKQSQPPSRGPRQPPEGFDFGAEFHSEPATGLCAHRAVIEPEDWETLLEAILSGSVPTDFGECRLAAHDWSPLVFLGSAGLTDQHRVSRGARRPLRAISAKLPGQDLPAIEATWQLDIPSDLKPGPELGRIWKERTLFNWPEELLGIDWHPDPEIEPPRSFLVGRVQGEAWIADVHPDYEHGELKFSIGWDAELIDPLACSLVFRAEESPEIISAARQIRISDLPTRDWPADRIDPRHQGATERLLQVAIPRGARRVDFGAMLLAADGRLLDALPLGPRIEQITMELGIKGAPGPTSRSTIGDPDPPPGPAERDRAVLDSERIDAEARQAASERRISGSGELSVYLRHRFSARSGELLILDPHLFEADPAALEAFMTSLDRPIRALTERLRRPVKKMVKRLANLEARELSAGGGALHDRIWIVGETGLMVGSSAASLINPKTRRTTTIAELSFADTAIWHQRFEEWWS